MNTVFLIAVISLPTVDIHITTLTGEPLHGKLAEINSDQVRIETDDGGLAVPLTDVVAVSLEQSQVPPPVPYAWLHLTDGSRLALAELTIQDKQVRAGLAVNSQASFDRQSVHTVRWPVSNAGANRDWPITTLQRWQELSKTEVTADRVVILRASPEQQTPMALRAIQGVIHGVNDQKIDFEFRGKRLDVTRPNKVGGLIFYQPPSVEQSSTFCQVIDRAGSTIQASALSSSENLESLQVKTVSQANVELPWSQIRRIDFSSGKILYLSDMDPESVEWTPLIGAGPTERLLSKLYTPRRDQGFNAQALNLKINGKDKTFRKGLALHSRTEIAYRFNGDFRRFQTVIGLDPRFGTQGHIQLIILGDDVPIFESEVRGGTEPLALDIDITGVRRFRILVDYGANLDVADHLFLCDCKVTK